MIIKLSTSALPAMIFFLAAPFGLSVPSHAGAGCLIEMNVNAPRPDSECTFPNFLTKKNTACVPNWKAPLENLGTHPLGGGMNQNSVYIVQGRYGIAPRGTAMHTADLSSCSALVVIDDKKQYLSHVDGTEDPRSIRHSLRGFDLSHPDTQIYLLPGSTRDMQPGANQILLALDKSIHPKIRVLQWPYREIRNTGRDRRHDYPTRGIQVFGDGSLGVGPNSMDGASYFLCP